MTNVTDITSRSIHSGVHGFIRARMDLGFTCPRPRRAGLQSPRGRAVPAVESLTAIPALHRCGSDQLRTSGAPLHLPGFERLRVDSTLIRAAHQLDQKAERNTARPLRGSGTPSSLFLNPRNSSALPSVIGHFFRQRNYDALQLSDFPSQIANNNKNNYKQFHIAP